MELSKIKKKGQLSLGDAPTVVLLVGLVFLVMATFAFIGEKYGNAIDTDGVAGTVTNESSAYINTTGYTLTDSSTKNFATPVIVDVYNATNGILIASGNYSVSSAGVLSNATATVWSNVNVSYTYTYTTETSSSNVTGDLQTEIGNNTSIAGIILTISLVGIVLTILIGVFVGVRRRRI